MDGNLAMSDKQTENNEPKIYRCGWCGNITDENGGCLTEDKFKEHAKIIEEHGDAFTKLTNGYCCPSGSV